MATLGQVYILTQSSAFKERVFCALIRKALIEYVNVNATAASRALSKNVCQMSRAADQLAVIVFTNIVAFRAEVHAEVITAENIVTPGALTDATLIGAIDAVWEKVALEADLLPA